MNKYFITTAIPYVNGKPHIGHALEYFQADTLRLYHNFLGQKTLLLSGADENALKNVQAAEKEGVPIHEFLDRNSEVFRKAYDALGVRLDIFERGSDEKSHFPGVKKLWELCNRRGDIYKKSYIGLYCVGCESFKTEKELINGLCPDHNKKPDEVTEENYFFKLSKYQDRLLVLIESNELQIVPENKRAEVIAFIKGGLVDFSISRSKVRARGVGVPVPNDSSQVIYVWFDALAIYITGIGFGRDEKMFKKWWPADVHVIGKDINRFHTVYWPAILLSAGLSLPKTILVHSFIESGGQKMSKSIGNVIDPFEIVEEYGLESVRYYLLSQIPLDSDGDFTEKRFKEIYNSDLANGLGNLVARVAKLAEKNDVAIPPYTQDLDPEVEKHMQIFRFDEALKYIWNKISTADKTMNKEKPWELEGEKAKAILVTLAEQIQHIAFNLRLFLPDTAEKIQSQFTGKIQSTQPLFPRLP